MGPMKRGSFLRASTLIYVGILMCGNALVHAETIENVTLDEKIDYGRLFPAIGVSGNTTEM